MHPRERPTGYWAMGVVAILGLGLGLSLWVRLGLAPVAALVVLVMAAPFAYGTARGLLYGAI